MKSKNEDGGKGKRPDGKPDASLESLVLEHVREGELPCALAFKIAKKGHVSPDQIGRCADFLKIRLTKCQMGLFGHTPEKKIVKPAAPLNPDLEKAINENRIEGKLSCSSAWEIASAMGIAKMTVSNACEAMKVKINQCQLGAF